MPDWSAFEERERRRFAEAIGGSGGDLDARAERAARAMRDAYLRRGAIEGAAALVRAVGRGLRAGATALARRREPA